MRTNALRKGIFMENGTSIDIITPVWNGEKWIDQYIKNLFSQTYQNFKIFFANDQSTDNTLEILQSYEKRYPEKIKVLTVPQNGGQGKARDYVLDSGLLEGEYLLCLDIDDIQEPVFLEAMVKTAIKYKVDLVMCGLDCFDDKTGRVINTQMTSCPEKVVYDVKNFHDIAYMNPAVWNKLYRREAVQNYRYGKARDVEDGIYLMRVLPSIRSIKFVNKILFHYRVGGQSALARLTGDKFRDRWSYYEELSEWIYAHIDGYKEYLDIFRLQIFIKCGIGLTHRVAFKDMRHMHKYVKYSKEKLNELAPGWKKDRHLLVKYNLFGNFKKFAVAFCALLYKLNCFELFIITYWLYRKLCRKEMRW